MSIPVSEALLAATQNRLVLARLLVQRGIYDPEEAVKILNPDRYLPAAPSELHDLDKGVRRIEQAIQNQELILVWGDFDVDGQTSTALLVSALKELGANVDYHIPIREKESHGIKSAFLLPFIEKGINVLLSCDTGIAANDAIALANEHDVDVVITDHHDLPETLPAAHALINPKFHETDHPLYSLPGVGVAYKVIEALFGNAGREDKLEPYLDLVAMGIVADIAHQTKDTRYLLQRGLSILRQTNRVGLQSLMRLGNVKADQIIDEDIGFQIGPRLNAVGRLSDANISVTLLTTGDRAVADEIANNLEDLNRDRRYKTSIVYDSALLQIERDPSLLQYAALVLANPEWHQGVIGIVASRLVEEFGKPTILLASPEDGLARGSARSIEGYHITDAIATQADYLHGFGGHPMAAGMALESHDIDRFRRGVSKAIIEQRAGKIPEATLDISLEVELADIGLVLAEEVELLAPFGAGNPPVNYLCRNVVVVKDEVFGQDLSHRKLYLGDERSKPVEVIWWGGAGMSLPDGELDVVFRMRPGYFRGERTLRITLQDYQHADRLRKEETIASYRIHDYRREPDPAASLQVLQTQQPAIQVWGEGVPAVDGMKSRHHLEPSRVLVIWSIPPDRATLLNVLDIVSPEEIYCFANDPDMDQPAKFLKRLVGLAKYALSQYNGETTLEALSAACAQSASCVIVGLSQLAKLGIDTSLEADGIVRLAQGRKQRGDGVDSALLNALKEHAAFRRAYATVEDLEAFLL